MAVIGRLISQEIDYGNPTDVRMKNGGDTGVVRPRIGGDPTPPKTSYAQICPDGRAYLGKDGRGRPICEPSRYRDKDKQAAYDKAIAQGIEWTGQYTKDEVTGEVRPKPIEEIGQELKSQIELEAKKAKEEVEKAIQSGEIVPTSSDNMLKKYWWVLAAIGVYLIISND
jgi:hypothetical protein